MSVKRVAERSTGGLWHFPAPSRGLFSRFFAYCGVVVISAAVAGCASAPAVRLQLGAGDLLPISSFPASIAADEPEAALAAAAILRSGGSAADAAVTLALSLAVTLPSSAGLGGGGLCNVYSATAAKADVLDFTARPSPEGDNLSVATAMLPRALFALHANYGRLPWAQVIAPAENMARFGVTVSRALADDLARDGQRLIKDRAALQTFMSDRRAMLEAGDKFMQSDLAETLARLRAVGKGGYTIDAVSASISTRRGRVVSGDDIPQWKPATAIDANGGKIFSLPETPPASGEKFKAGSTGFIVADSKGAVVACALTMGAPFGTGVMVAQSGALTAATSQGHDAAATIAAGRDKLPQFAVVSAGVGAQQNARLLTAALMVRGVEALAGNAPAEPAQMNAFACGTVKDAVSVACRAVSDARGSGHAIMINAGK